MQRQGKPQPDLGEFWLVVWSHRRQTILTEEE